MRDEECGIRHSSLVLVLVLVLVLEE